MARGHSPAIVVHVVIKMGLTLSLTAAIAAAPADHEFVSILCCIRSTRRIAGFTVKSHRGGAAGGQREVDLGGIALAAVFLIPVGEGLADLVGEVFELLFLALLGFGVAGGGSLLAGDEVGEGVGRAAGAGRHGW